MPEDILKLLPLAASSWMETVHTACKSLQPSHEPHSRGKKQAPVTPIKSEEKKLRVGREEH